jgi:signal transduction histidine kinase
VLLQLGFSVLLLAVVFIALSVLYSEILNNVVSGILDTIAHGGTPGGLSAELEYAKEKNMILAGTAVLIFAAIFGYLIARLALAPTRRALDTQKRFVSNIAHELRTPLAIIKTNTEVALLNDRIASDIKEMLGSNIEELDRISEIINNLLSMNTLLRPGKLTFENIDLGPVVDRVRSALAELAAHKRITIGSELSPRRTIWGNSAGVEQIIMNIAKNAVNYSPIEGHVIFRVTPAYPGHIVLAVEDHGPGIPEAELEKIFEPFYRGDWSRTRKGGGGSGLGLTIVNELVKLHKGTIAVKSVVGRGTTVTVTFPAGHGLPKEPPTLPEHALS